MKVRARRSSPGRILAVIFDLDGTLTVPVLDFDQIRREIGSVDGPILEALERLAPERRQEAEAILARHELHAARSSVLQPGAGELLGRLREQGIGIAVLTRNSRRSLDTVLERHGLRVDAVWTREDGPPKPAPHPVLSVCARLGVAPEETLVVGDYLFDLQAANAAGAVSVLLESEHNRAFASEARYVIRSLADVVEIVG